MDGFHNGVVKIQNGFINLKNAPDEFQNGAAKINNNFSKSENMDQIPENGKILECCSAESGYHAEANPMVCILI